jgi:hypothetical protein
MTTITQEAAMQDDVERVAAAIQQAFYEGGGYEGMARAAMAATLELTAEAMRELAKSRPYVSDNENLRREESINITADWLQQRAKGQTDA